VIRLNVNIVDVVGADVVALNQRINIDMIPGLFGVFTEDKVVPFLSLSSLPAPFVIEAREAYLVEHIHVNHEAANSCPVNFNQMVFIVGKRSIAFLPVNIAVVDIFSPLFPPGNRAVGRGLKIIKT
jgi:hypothetical protein